MKQFKRLAAVLVLGAMVLSMFTACSTTAAKKERVLEAIKIVTENEDAVFNDELQKDAEYVAEKFLAGEKLESNKEAGRAYAKVDSSDAKFWEIINRSANDNRGDWTGPIFKNRYSSGVNIGLLLPYSENTMRMTQDMWQIGNTVECLKQCNNFGIAIVNVEGDDYVLIVGENY